MPADAITTPKRLCIKLMIGAIAFSFLSCVTSGFWRVDAFQILAHTRNISKQRLPLVTSV